MYELTIVRRRVSESSHITVRSAVDVYDHFRGMIEALDREHFYVVLLDAKNHLTDFNLVSVGSLTSTIVHTREVFKAAILGNAAAIILMHNHLSGDPQPSTEDIAITRRIRQAAHVMDIGVLDHIVFGDGKFISFCDDGYWEPI